MTANFQSSLSISDTTGEVVNHTGSGDSGVLQQYCDTGCQTDPLGEVGNHTSTRTSICSFYKPELTLCLCCSFKYGSQDATHLVDKVKVNWQYEEAKKKYVCVFICQL